MTGFGAQPLPAERVARVEQQRRRRIDDILEEAFQHACVNGDLDTAADVIDVLERKLERWIRLHGKDTRRGAFQIARMHDELSRLIRQREAGPLPEIVEPSEPEFGRKARFSAPKEMSRRR